MIRKWQRVLKHHYYDFRLWLYRVSFPWRRRFWHAMYYLGIYLQTAAINFMVGHNVPMPPDELMAEDRYYRPLQDRYWRDYD